MQISCKKSKCVLRVATLNPAPLARFCTCIALKFYRKKYYNRETGESSKDCLHTLKLKQATPLISQQIFPGNQNKYTNKLKHFNNVYQSGQ